MDKDQANEIVNTLRSLIEEGDGSSECIGEILHEVLQHTLNLSAQEYESEITPLLQCALQQSVIKSPASLSHFPRGMEAFRTFITAFVRCVVIG